MLNFLRKQMKWVMAVIVVAFLLSTFLMYEGRTTRRTPGRNPDGSMTDYEVATINGRSLMRSELERRLRDYLSSYSSRSAESLDMPAIYQAVLDQAVLEAQLAKEVEEKGIRVSDAEADRAMKTYADTYYPTRETFYQALANSGVKVEDYKRSLARQLATQQVVQNAIGEIVISEDRAMEFYETMKALIYSKPEGYMLHMADFRNNEDAEFLRAKLEAGESWAEIVSKDELASRDVVNITRTPVFLPATAFTAGTLSALASVDVGKVSPVFSVTSSDFAVAVKTEHVDASVSPYAEVSGDIKTMLTNQEERTRLNAYQQGLLKSAQLVVHDQELFARKAVSEDTTPAVEDVIPELAETPVVSNEPKPAAETPKADETPKTEVTPSVVEEATPAPETPAPAEEPTPAAETPTPEVTPAVVEEAKPAQETPAPAETPAVVEEAKPAPETPAVVEETKPAADTPAPAETPVVVEEPAPAAEPITKSEDIPLQSEVKTEVQTIVDEVNQAIQAATTPASQDSQQ